MAQKRLRAEVIREISTKNSMTKGKYKIGSTRNRWSIACSRDVAVDANVKHIWSRAEKHPKATSHKEAKR